MLTAVALTVPLQTPLTLPDGSTLANGATPVFALPQSAPPNAAPETRALAPQAEVVPLMAFLEAVDPASAQAPAALETALMPEGANLDAGPERSVTPPLDMTARDLSPVLAALLPMAAPVFSQAPSPALPLSAASLRADRPAVSLLAAKPAIAAAAPQARFPDAVPLAQTAGRKRGDTASLLPFVPTAPQGGDPVSVPVVTTAREPVAAETLVLTRQLDLSRETLWLDRLARDIAGAGTADGRLRFELSPPALGRMDVIIQQSDSGLHLRLTTQTEAARAIIAEAQPRLTDDLRGHGVRIAETQVSADGSRQPFGQRPQLAPPPLIETAADQSFSDAPSTPERAIPRDGRFA